MTTRVVSLALAGVLAAVAFDARAGQPLVTDDAALVTPRTCQLEAWTLPSRDGTQYWMQPACNPTGNLELAVGLASNRPDDDARSSQILLQGKTLFHSLPDNSWSFGVVGGASRDTGAPRGGPAFQTYFAQALASWFPSEDLEIDLNLGAANAWGSGTYALAAAAIQYRIVDRMQLLAEVFKDAPGKGAWQVGTRFFVIPDRLEAYAAYRNSFGEWTGDWSVNIGIRLQSPAFIP